MMPIYDEILIYGIFEILSIQTFCRCDYYITEVSILQGNPVKQVLKNYTKTELWKLVISHNSACYIILLLHRLICVQIYSCTELNILASRNRNSGVMKTCTLDTEDISKVNPVRTALLR